MRVAIDARPAVARGKTGVGWYAWHLIRHLPLVDPDTRYLAWYLYARRLLGKPLFFTDIEAANFEERWTPFPARLFWRMSRREVPRVEWLIRFDLLFATNFVPPPTRKPYVVAVHDLAFRRHPDSVPAPTLQWLEAQLPGSLRRAAGVVVPSEATARDLVELYDVEEGRITVTPLGVDHATYRPVGAGAIDEVGGRFGIPGRYILYVGGIEPRKNVATLVRAFARAAPHVDATLVVSGAAVAWDRESSAEVRAAIDGLPPPVRRRVVLTGYLDEPEKAALLSGASLFVYPSLYEGFGLPVVEAMACGTPVLTSDVPALRETAGEAAIHVDARDEDAIASGIRRVLEDANVHARLREAGLVRARGFDWERTASRTADALRRAANA